MKKIISKTITFIAVLLFIVAFKAVFGEENSLVGVTTVIAVLILMSENLILNPVSNFLKLLIVNLIIGAGAFISSQNSYFGIVMNFIILGFIGYFFSYNLTKTVILPFGLQYLFILYDPVFGNVLFKRFLSLLIGPILIMISQYLIYGRKKKVDIEKSNILEFRKTDESYENVILFNKKVKVNKIRAYYAFRLSLLITIIAFLNDILLISRGNLEGRWMVYTIFSLTELYSDNCRVKSKKRLEGTLIGTGIVIVLFMFLKSPKLRGLVIFIAGYLNSLFEDYRDTIICVTVSAVASLALTNGTLAAAFYRILFVCIGIVVALIGNKYIFFDTHQTSD